MKQTLFNQRWWIAGSVFAGLSMFCAARHGMLELAADRVWEEADRANAAVAEARAKLVAEGHEFQSPKFPPPEAPKES